MDFGAFLYWNTKGEELPGYALLGSFSYSNKGYTQTFPAQDKECLLEGRKRIFEHIDGIPPVLRFDNMTTAVVQVHKGTIRVLTDAFTCFMLHTTGFGPTSAIRSPAIRKAMQRTRLNTATGMLLCRFPPVLSLTIPTSIRGSSAKRMPSDLTKLQAQGS